MFLDCRLGTLPTVVPTAGRIQVLLTDEAQALNGGGGGLTDYFSTPDTAWKWRNDRVPAFAYRCELTNYTATVLVDIRLGLTVEFWKAEPVPEDGPSARRRGALSVKRAWMIDITKVDPGSDHPYAFYIYNCCSDRFVSIKFADAGVMFGSGGAKQLSLRQSAMNLRLDLNPSSFWDSPAR